MMENDHIMNKKSIFRIFYQCYYISFKLYLANMTLCSTLLKNEYCAVQNVIRNLITVFIKKEVASIKN